MKRNLIALALVSFAALVSPATSFAVEGREACTASVEGTAQQAAAAEACDRYQHERGGEI
jgi:hypothetical protein